MKRFYFFSSKNLSFLEFQGIFKKVETKKKIFRQNIWRLFHFLEEFSFTTNETKLDYYHQRLSVRAASRVAERLKI